MTRAGINVLKLTSAESDTLSRRDCDRCGLPASAVRHGFHNILCERNGTLISVWCQACTDADRAEHDAARKAELAARPDCPLCGRRKVTMTLLPGYPAETDACGGCGRRARWNLRASILTPVSYRGLTCADVARAAAGPPPPKGMRI